jgi:hypothetical protein
MALCRCLQSHAWPKGRTRYVGFVFPVGYPNASSICGRCDNVGVIWLDNSESERYARGQRIFDGPSAFTRMKADDVGLQKNPKGFNGHK